MIQNVIEAGAQSQGNHKTMVGCTDVDFRTLTVIFGKLYTWMKKALRDNDHQELSNPT
jgi:hypothetical protein